MLPALTNNIKVIDEFQCTSQDFLFNHFAMTTKCTHLNANLIQAPESENDQLVNESLIEQSKDELKEEIKK